MNCNAKWEADKHVERGCHEWGCSHCSQNTIKYPKKTHLVVSAECSGSVGETIKDLSCSGWKIANNVCMIMERDGEHCLVKLDGHIELVS